jgi:hypothetical protein
VCIRTHILERFTPHGPALVPELASNGRESFCRAIQNVHRSRLDHTAQIFSSNADRQIDEPVAVEIGRGQGGAENVTLLRLVVDSAAVLVPQLTSSCG